MSKYREEIKAWGPLGRPPDIVIRCGKGRIWDKGVELSKDARMVHGTLSEKKRKSDEISKKKKEIIELAQWQMKAKQ